MFLSANNEELAQLDVNKELNEIEDGFRDAQAINEFKLETRPDISREKLVRVILAHRPQILHFSGHGSDRSNIFMKSDETGRIEVISKEDFSNVFKALKDDAPLLVFLNACYSDGQAEEIAKYVKCVIGMSQSISDTSARKFSVSFYNFLGYRKNVQKAYDLALVELPKADQSIPKIFPEGGVDLDFSPLDTRHLEVPKENIPPLEIPKYKKISELPVNTCGNPVLMQSVIGNSRNYELCVPKLTTGIYSFYRDNSDRSFPWIRLSCTDDLAHVDSVTLIQSNFGNPPGKDFSIKAGHFELIARVGSRLQHFSRYVVNREDTWKQESDIDTGTEATGNPVLVQSSFGEGAGHFMLVVPNSVSGIDLYWRDNNDKNYPWYGPKNFGSEVGAVNALTMIQSNLLTSGSLEVVARVGPHLHHFSGYYESDKDKDPITWTRKPDFGNEATGNPVLVQSSFGEGPGHFMLVVPNSVSGIDLYWRDNNDKNYPWYGPKNFGSEVGAVNALTMIQSNLLTSGSLEVVARVGPHLHHFSGYYESDKDKDPITWTTTDPDPN